MFGLVMEVNGGQSTMFCGIWKWNDIMAFDLLFFSDVGWLRCLWIKMHKAEGITTGET